MSRSVVFIMIKAVDKRDFDVGMCACETYFSERRLVYYFIWTFMTANLRFPDLVMKQSVMHNLTISFSM